jgi:hypothetical protein
MKVKEPDLLEFGEWFEMALNQATKAERKDKRLKMHNFPFPNGIVQTDDQIFNLFNGI